MLRIRFVCVAAATLSIASVAAAGGANAQSASTDPGNTPSLLTQLFSQATTTPAPATTAPAPVSTAAPPVQTTRSRRVASRKHRAYTKQATNQHGDRSADTAQSNSSADAWLAASAPPTNATPTNSDAPQMAAANPAQQDTTPSASTASPSSVMVGGQTVQIAEADQVNEIDLAASSAPANAPADSAPTSNALAANAPGDVTTGPTVQSTMESTLPRGDRADMIGAAAVKAAQVDAAQTAFAAAAPAAPNAGGETIADPGPPNAAAQDSGAQIINDQSAAVQDSGAQDSGMLGGVAWIAQVLAALGGALTAGIVAWVLIGAEPVRTYG